MGIEVKLEVFEGPLDLLLHLIEKNKIDIYNRDYRPVYGICKPNEYCRPGYYE